MCKGVQHHFCCQCFGHSALSMLTKTASFVTRNATNQIISPLKINGNTRIKALFLCPLPGGEEVQLIMEYVPQGNLKDYLPNRKVGMSHCLMFAQQICQVSFIVYTNHVHFPPGSAQFKCSIVIVLALWILSATKCIRHW